MGNNQLVQADYLEFKLIIRQAVHSQGSGCYPRRLKAAVFRGYPGSGHRVPAAAAVGIHDAGGWFKHLPLATADIEGHLKVFLDLGDPFLGRS